MKKWVIQLFWCAIAITSSTESTKSKNKSPKQITYAAAALEHYLSCPIQLLNALFKVAIILNTIYFASTIKIYSV